MISTREMRRIGRGGTEKKNQKNEAFVTSRLDILEFLDTCTEIASRVGPGEICKSVGANGLDLLVFFKSVAVEARNVESEVQTVIGHLGVAQQEVLRGTLRLSDKFGHSLSQGRQVSAESDARALASADADQQSRSSWPQP